MKSRTFFRFWYGWVGLVAAAFALGTLAFSAVRTATTFGRISGWTEVCATVVDYDEDKLGTGTNRRWMWGEIVEYEAEGKVYRATNFGYSRTPKALGEQIKIVYNPENPAECSFVGEEIALTVFLFAFGAAFAGFAAALIACEIREDKKMKYANAKFITSAARKDQFIQTDKPIIAVCGKSNVGKSSFINMLAGQNKLAKVSKEPGRTRLINYFDFGEFILADLPGYGFARVSKEEKLKWARLLDDFFADRSKITHVFSLADIRHEPTADDRQMIEYLYAEIIPFTVIATKSDKLSRAQIAKNLTVIASVFKCGKDDIIPTSAKSRAGFDEVYAKIYRIIKNGEEDV